MGVLDESYLLLKYFQNSGVLKIALMLLSEIHFVFRAYFVSEIINLRDLLMHRALFISYWYPELCLINILAH